MTSASLLRLVRPVWAAGLPGAAMVLPEFRNAVPDLHIPALIAGDREIAHALYRGEFSFAGCRVRAAANGVFAEAPPSLAWWRALHSFGWITDLLGSGFELHRAYARAQLQAWHAAATKSAARRDPGVTAKRLIIVAQYWPELLRGASMAFAQDLARIASRDTAALMACLPRQAGSKDGLVSALALARAALSFRGFDSLKAFALSRLAGELDRFVLPDGGPLTRNASDLVDVLADLVPLRDAMTLARREVPYPIHAAIERSMPMLRFFSHGDGGLALFQGVAALRVRALRALLERDTVYGRPYVHAVHSGFVRLQHGSSCMIMDVKSGPLATAPLAFEFSDHAQRIVVNCGFPLDQHPGWMSACSRTAAHSTVVLGEHDPGTGESLRMLIGSFRQKAERFPETAVETLTAADGEVVRAEHQGYAASHNLVHQRSVYLANSGRDLRGEDCILAADSRGRDPQDVAFVIRFHLHPGVKATMSRDGAGVLLLLANKAGWQFSSRGGTLSLEDSIYLASEGEPRNSQQIVIRGIAAWPSRVNWAFKALGRTAKRGATKDEAPQLPF